MIPTIGRIVHYKLNGLDAAAINKRRDDVTNAGNGAKEGDVFPMMITKVWANDPAPQTAVNGMVFLDGNFVHWVTSVQHGDQQRQYRWPVY